VSCEILDEISSAQLKLQNLKRVGCETEHGISANNGTIQVTVAGNQLKSSERQIGTVSKT
jgi:hypothetical protein